MASPSEGSATHQQSPMINKKDALDTISKFLNQEWCQTTEPDINITRLQGGYVNTLYIVENKSEKVKNEPKKLILRFYGGNFFGDDKRALSKDLPMSSEVEESLIFYTQSKNLNGPKLYGIFPGGRVEEFISSHCLTHEEALRLDIIVDTAKAYARFHCQDPLPLDRTKKNCMFKILPFDSRVFETPEIKSLGIDFSPLLSIDRESETEFVKKIHDRVETKEGLLHIDCQYLNVLVREQEPEPGQLKTVMIDYEACMYGPRYCDIASHFYTHMLDATRKDTKLSGHDLPDEQTRRQFMREYLKEIQRLKPEDFDPKIDNEEHLMMETDLGLMLYCVFAMNAMLSMAGVFAKEPALMSIFQLLSSYYPEAKKNFCDKYPNLIE